MFEIGTSLREARLRQQLDFPELEYRTKIRAKYLRALEDERFELLPSSTYVKGFLRSYADQLGLDGQLYVDEFNSRYVAGEEETPLRARRVPAARNRKRDRRESNVALLALTAIGLVTALVIAAWKFGGADDPSVRGLATVPTTTSSATTAAPRSTDIPLLSLTAVGGDSRLEVRQGTALGKLVYSGTLESGRTESFHGDALFVALSRPANVRVLVKGEPAALGRQWATYLVTERGIAKTRAGA
jgi:hypothetical protein